jgi:ABC-2 type transport system permease protein
MNQVLALAVKDLLILWRDKIGSFFIFFFPLIYCVFFGSIFAGSGGGSSAIEIAVVDEDNTEESQAFVARLQKVAELSVAPTSRDEGADQVRRGKRVGYVAIPAGFGEARRRMFWGEPPKLEVGLDPSRHAESAMLQGLLTKYLMEGMQELFSNPASMRERIQGWLADLESAQDMDPVARGTLRFFFSAMDRLMQDMPRIAGTDGSGPRWQPAIFESVSVTRQRRGPKNAYEVSFPQGMIWGVLGSAAGFGISLVTERSKGTLIRLRMAPISPVQILAGKAAACFTTILFLQMVLIGIGWSVFGVKPHSPLLLLLAFICVAVAFVGIMMLLSVLGKTEQAAGGIGWAILTCMAMLGGGMIPQFFMPAWLKGISHVSPVKWAIQAMDGAIWRQFSFTEMLGPLVVLIAVGVVCFVVGTRAFQWSE